MEQYHDLLEDILENGRLKGDRTGTGTISVFGRQLRFDLRKGFPLLTTKEVNFNSIKAELLWFLAGDTNTKFLKENKCNIWNAWATETGDLGPIYGKQWREWISSSWPDGSYTPKTIDQIAEVINLLKTKPDSRRIIVSAWNPAYLPDESVSPQENVLNGKMSLAACHTMFQFYSVEMTSEEKCNYLHSIYPEAYEELVSEDTVEKDYENVEKYFEEYNLPSRYLSCQLYQRSADVFLGVPYNIASYALLTHMIARCVNMVPYEFVHTFGDCHAYTNHFGQIEEQLSRSYDMYTLPRLRLNPNIENINAFKMEDIEVIGYESYPAIKAPIAV
jgi:thymidylate synthase